MLTKILFLGLDVDDKAFHGFAQGEQEDERFEFSCKPTVQALERKLQRFTDAGYQLKICYEATYLGFSLQRQIQRLGHECHVIAPTLIPEHCGPKVKTDRLDSRKLAQYFQKGLLTSVHVPSEKEETTRDLMRSKAFVKDQIGTYKRHILSLCRRMGLNYRNSNRPRQTQNHWSLDHFDWLESLLKEHPEPVFKLNLKLLLASLRQQEALLGIYIVEVEGLARSPEFKKKVEALTVYRGIDLQHAMSWVVEVQDIRRFKHPRSMVSYVGMDIREYSSGGKENKFGITKMGNPYMRTALVEICQSASKVPRVGRPLLKRREGIDPALVEIADRCMARLYQKSSKMLYRGKHPNKIKVACARELIGFLWESLNQAA